MTRALLQLRTPASIVASVEAAGNSAKTSVDVANFEHMTALALDAYAFVSARAGTPVRKVHVTFGAEPPEAGVYASSLMKRNGQSYMNFFDRATRDASEGMQQLLEGAPWEQWPFSARIAFAEEAHSALHEARHLAKRSNVWEAATELEERLVQIASISDVPAFMRAETGIEVGSEIMTMLHASNHGHVHATVDGALQLAAPSEAERLALARELATLETGRQRVILADRIAARTAPSVSRTRAIAVLVPAIERQTEHHRAGAVVEAIRGLRGGPNSTPARPLTEAAERKAGVLARLSPSPPV